MGGPASHNYPSYQGSNEPSIMSQPNLGLNTSPRPTGRKLTESRTVVNRQASILDENRIVLYKKGKRMGKGYYIVEISSCHTTMYITAFNVEKPQSLILEIPEKRARYILEQFDHDVEQLAGSLTVANNSKLILLNPHYNSPPKAALSLKARYSEQPTSTRYHTMMNFSSSDGAMMHPGMDPNEHVNNTVIVGSDLDQTMSNQEDLD